MGLGLVGLHRIRKLSQRGEDGDVYLGRLLKLIPAEALAIYPIGKAAGKAASSPELATYWPFVGALVVIALRIFTTQDRGRRTQVASVIISLITYVIWVLSNGDSFGPISLNFPDANVWLVWAGLGWIAVASIFYRGS